MSTKNAYVIRGYAHGSEQTHDDQVIEDMPRDLFDALQENNLVREATEAEIAAARKKAAEPAKRAKEPANKKAAEPANKAG
jgi:hypothetical protein